MYDGTNESFTAPTATMGAYKANECYRECLIKLHLTVQRNNQLSGLQPVCLEAGDTRELWAPFGSLTHVTSENCDVTDWCQRMSLKRWLRRVLSAVSVHRRFAGMYSPHVHGAKVSQEANQQVVGISFVIQYHSIQQTYSRNPIIRIANWLTHGNKEMRLLKEHHCFTSSKTC
jgi:hypothetical protein